MKLRPRHVRDAPATDPSVDTVEWLIALEAGQGVPHPAVALIAALVSGLRAVRRAVARLLG